MSTSSNLQRLTRFAAVCMADVDHVNYLTCSPEVRERYDLYAHRLLSALPRGILIQIDESAWIASWRDHNPE